MSTTYDICIAGAGIVGLSTAYQLIREQPDLRIAIVEKESAVGQHQSSRNSGVIHSGVYYEPGSQKALNCIDGYQRLLKFADEYDIPYKICGKVIVAKAEEEIPTLNTIIQRGKQNGLQGLKIIDPDEIREIEPHVRAIQAVWVPQAGIIDFGAVCQALAQYLIANSVKLLFNSAVTHIDRKGGSVSIHTTGGNVASNVFVNCTGLYADKVAKMTGMAGDFKVLPFRGEYYRLKPHAKHLARNLIYPVPDMRFPFLGVHFTRRMNGDMEAGPNAVLAFRREGYHFSQVYFPELRETLAYPGFRRLAARYWSFGLDEFRRSVSPRHFYRSLKALIPDLQFADIERARTGVRAQCVARDGSLMYDYAILEDEQVINVCNAPSPAATSCLAIGAFLKDKILAKL